MIIRRDKSWLRLVFFVRKGTIIEEIWARFGLSVLLAVAVTYAFMHGVTNVSLTTTPFTILGFALSIFLGFRNNAAYDRFWEGRKLWGALVNESRTITRQLLTCLEPGEGDGDDQEVKAFAEEMVRWIAAYPHALRIHLRGQSDWHTLARLIGDDTVERLGPEGNKPIALIQWMGDRLHLARERRWLDSYHHVLLEQQLLQLTNIQGACERIKNTPIPLSHTAVTHRLVGAYIWSLPFGLVSTIGWVTPVVVSLVAYAFFALDALGEELEDPFGIDCNDLPLSQLSTMIEHNVLQRIGDSDLPELLRPNALDVVL
jgi:putative membrane protein